MSATLRWVWPIRVPGSIGRARNAAVLVASSVFASDIAISPSGSVSRSLITSVAGRPRQEQRPSAVRLRDELPRALEAEAERHLEGDAEKGEPFQLAGAFEL